MYAFLPVLIGAALIAYIALTVDLSRIWAIARRADPLFLALAFSLPLVEIAVKALKIKTAASPFGSLSVRNAAAVHLIGVTLGSITPGQVGDFGKLYILKKKLKVDAVSGLAIIFLDRSLELLVLLSMATVGIAAVLVLRGSDKILVGILVLAVAGASLLVFLLKKNYVRRVYLLIAGVLFPSSRSHAGVLANIDSFYDALGTIGKKRSTIPVVIALIVLWWAMVFGHLYLLALALHINITYLNIAVFTPIVTVVELLPITVMGFGTREYAMILLLGTIGITMEESVALSLGGFVLSFVPQVIPGYFLLIKEHLSKDKSWNQAA